MLSPPTVFLNSVNYHTLPGLPEHINHTVRCFQQEIHIRINAWMHNKTPIMRMERVYIVFPISLALSQLPPSLAQFLKIIFFAM